MTEFPIGADASCSDGPCGKLIRLIVDPETQALTHLVIEPGHRGGPERFVPIDLVDTAAGEIKLRCTIAEFGRLEPAEEQGLQASDSGRPLNHPGSARFIGTGDGGLTMANLRGNDDAKVASHDTVPMGEVDVRRGEPVYATDGEIGKIQGLVIDSGSHHVTHVLLEEGHLWGRKEVAIPIGSVTRVGDIIQLTIDMRQVRDLPRVDVDHLAT
jgi:sporulation protein YlmC with PRC-barrel domain